MKILDGFRSQHASIRFDPRLGNGELSNSGDPLLQAKRSVFNAVDGRRC